MRRIIPMICCLMLLAACGQSYEETKRIARENRRLALKKDSAALKIAVMPTLDCLPLYVAEQYELFDTLNGGVRLKLFHAQMDCDTALERGRVEGAMTDLVRAKHIENGGLKLRYVTSTALHWKLISNRNARVRQLKQLDDKMVAMTRFSATDMLTDRVTDSVKLDKDRVFKVQINDIHVRMLMLLNNEMDALWLPEPLATQAVLMKHPVIYDTERQDIRLGVMAFRQKEMERKERTKQLELLLKAYGQACDSINKYGVRHYRKLLSTRCQVKEQVIDSLSAKIRFEHVQSPRDKDIALAEQWIGKK